MFDSDDVCKPFIDRARDWLRGYSDDDVRSVEEKMAGSHEHGAVIEVTAQEMRAICDGYGKTLPSADATNELKGILKR